MSGRIETGSCFCGAIAAEMRGEPFWVCYDHDDDCRRAIGSPLTIWVGYRPNQFRLIRGTPKSFSKTKGVSRTFCPECGTSISYLDAGLPDELYVTIGFLDSPERFQPQAHAYWRMKLPCVAFSDDLPRIKSYSRQRDPALGDPADRQWGPNAEPK
jgi:hypothetical protein